MRTPLALLRFLGKALLHAAGVAILGDVADFILEVGPDIVKDVWDWWDPGRDEDDKRAELEALARLPAREARAAATLVVDEIAADRPAVVRQVLTDYLTQVPATIRQTLRRPGALRNKTPRLREAKDLLPLLPSRVAHFRAGDRPLPGVDWELVELLGAGGFGEVWKARNPHFDGVTLVALKFCQHPDARRLLQHEAGLLNRVMRQGTHPGIVPLLHTYLYADPPCLAYEYVEGGDLTGLIHDWHGYPAAPPARVREEAAQLLADLADVLAFAHRLEPPIVHRDLKPANILVQRTGAGHIRPRVADFGIGGVAARSALGRAGCGITPSQQLLTALRGAHTPLYASPQQARGDAPDPRDDVYALGVIWYQLLTGELTTGRPGGTRWLKRLSGQGLPNAQLELLGACFEDNPADRPADAGILADALRQAVTAPVVVQVAPAARPAMAHRIGPLRRFDGHTAPIESVAFARDGRHVVSGGADKTVRVWDVETGQEQRRFEGHRRWVLGVDGAPDGRQVLSAGWDRTVRLWNVETGWEARRFEGHRGRVLAAAFSRDGRRVLSAGADRAVRLWEVDGGRELHGFVGPGDLAWSAATLCADGRLALSGSADGAVRLWDVSNGKQLRVFEGHARPVLSLALSADGRRALSGGWDRAMRLWDVETGKEIRRLEGHTEWVWSAAFAPDGRRALSGGADGTVRLWDVATGKELLRFEGHTKPVHSVAFAPDGRCALSGGADHTVRLWGLPE
jgi:hypothetical protein